MGREIRSWHIARRSDLAHMFNSEELESGTHRRRTAAGLPEHDSDASAQPARNRPSAAATVSFNAPRDQPGSCAEHSRRGRSK
jgi:hypothetical protein